MQTFGPYIESCECHVISSHFREFRQIDCVSLSSKLKSKHNAAKSESEADFDSTEIIPYLEVIQSYCLVPFAHMLMAYDHHSVKKLQV